jgi:Na+/glutamate symporter
VVVGLLLLQNALGIGMAKLLGLDGEERQHQRIFEAHIEINIDIHTFFQHQQRQRHHANLASLRAGGKVLGTFLIVVVGLLLLQNALGIGMAKERQHQRIFEAHIEINIDIHTFFQHQQRQRHQQTATIGLNANLASLRAGGKVLGTFLIVVVGLLLLQKAKP